MMLSIGRNVLIFLTTKCILLAVTSAGYSSNRLSPSARKFRQDVPCFNKEGKFYRNPNRTESRYWKTGECAKYYLCIEDHVMEFRCSSGLTFDVVRQICDFKDRVTNCDITQEATAPPPMLNPTHCEQDDEYACADGRCLQREYFCDGAVDCDDGSDESNCDQDTDPNAAPVCDLRKCVLPDCFCSKDGTLIPGQLEPSQVPQMILLTFDDAVNHENWDLYTRDIFNGSFTNPNGCPIHATMFLSHEYTNYQNVQKLWNDGHEIAVHSITHRGPERWWSKNATIEDWFDEMVGQANIINRFAGIKMDDIRGIRVPFLRVGWNRQFLMMKEFGFTYDSSMAAPPTTPPIWPYTLDYKIPHPCLGTGQRCPTRSFPGIWEMVMNQLTSEDYTCSMVDSCPSYFEEKEIYDMLMSNFNRHYKSNRAPYGLYFHTTWFKKKDNIRAFLRFITDVRKLPDTWFTTNWEAIQWMREPTPVQQLTSFEPWKCQKQVDPEDKACSLPKSCRLNNRQLRGDRYLHTCYECPDQYPWLRNELGLDL